MKPYLVLLLCCLTYHSFGQTKTNYPPFLSIKDVTFKSAGITLEGTVYKPRHPKAALVLVHGSGQETRMLKMASILAEKGIAVLTYDKRGVGKSGGIYAGPEVGTNNIDSANLNLLALDASAASNTLLRHLPRRDMPLGLMGFSQAGWIIPIAAKINHKVNFMVVFSGPLVNTLEQLRFQFYTNGNPGFWDTHTENEAREHVRNDPDRYQFVATDPQDALSKLSIPGLWIFGGKDIQIPVGLSIEKLNLLKAIGKPYEYCLFPELTHNTASSKSPETINNAIQWIQTIAERMKKK
ncbi:MAG: alpha/beta hydrolase [Sphingobacteriales bacterium 17-39-43]|uniref:alpha/beta hydrolase family protein n=1 Tax=Daejeonella sp. TaxID=2805397 RepID=UPI000BC45688|nr:alpha/beta hydrolase [Daejeonella sp.]OYZ33532.1 MAG: alpha/beta hydrolase [Sphingobacteriales bacterium 16-39-50]OZA26789.1 MAG: alpha/beta hydrolase [Sphingobacteriales bacterium 17-39-43]HQT21676.1 alpha/beta hydrolase [Daejeonella sp.]HQT56407.1 alpha/beta hydrolase [Daejeonella sp.]